MNIKIASQGDVWLVNFDPTKGSEIKKTRPAIVIESYVFRSQSMTFLKNQSCKKHLCGLHNSARRECTGKL